MWRPGRKLIHPFNPELGVGLVVAVEGRFLQVRFPDAQRDLTLAAEGAGLEPLVLAPGARAIHLDSGDEVEVSAVDGLRYQLADGRWVDDADLWPAVDSGTPVERLASGRVDTAEALASRIEALGLQQVREAGGLGRFLGGRIELFPHQLFTARRAVLQDPVRWLIADEVGLGKTIEACMICTALVRTGRAQRVLIAAPATLTVQWLGELYRKFNEVFVLLDPELVEGTRATVGEDANPFEVHGRAVIDLELLRGDPALLEEALAVPPDLLIVDEAHRLAAGDGGPALDELVRSATHAVLLSATPLAADREGFFHLLSLLHPDRFASFAAFEAQVASGEAEIPCASAVRRQDVGGLPPRVPQAVDLPATPAGAGVDADPRAAWLATALAEGAERGEKALVFVRDLATLQALKAFLESRLRTRVAVFHEDMTAAARDIEVAGFRDTGLPVLLCTEAGGEGRNFQFCARLIHYDLPLTPLALEQRIGRLDRIGRDGPVEIVYFRQPGAEPDLAHIYERLELFARPSAEIDRTLAGVGRALAADAEGAPFDLDAAAQAVAAARDQARSDLVPVSYADAYTPDQAEAVLTHVPPDLEERTRRFTLGAARALGLDVIEKGGRALYYLEFGAGATIDALVGLSDGQRWLGTFDRPEALRRDELDFFSSGHPLVEALLLENDDGNRGRAALLDLRGAAKVGAGILLLHHAPPAWTATVVDLDGRPRPEWSEPILAAVPAAKDLPLPGHPSFGDRIRELADGVEAEGRLVAAAFFHGDG